MTDLTRIFEPLTGKNDQLSSIDIVAFDVFGTLIDHDMRPKEKNLHFAHYLLQSNTVKVAFLSTQPERAHKALLRAGCTLFALQEGVQSKTDFYNACASNGKKILAIDDDAKDARAAHIYIDPNNETVRRYFDTKGYRHPALFKA